MPHGEHNGLMTTTQCRPVGRVVTLLFAIWLVAPVSTTQVDVAELLARAREAMGGDAALKAITTVTVTGSLVEDIGPKKLETAVEYFYELPDKFARRGARSFETGPETTGRMTLRDGFNGDGLIAERHTPNMGVNPTLEIRDAGPRLSAEAVRQQQVLSAKRDFVRLMWPLFAESMVVHPLTFTYVGADTVTFVRGGPATSVHVIEAKDRTFYAFRLYLDQSTGLPIMVSWLSRPPVVYSQSIYVTTQGGISTPANVPPAIVPMQPSQAPPGGVTVTSPNAAADPTAGMANIEYRRALTDYKLQDGLRWPHRFTTRVGDRVSDDLRLGKFNLNKPIKASTFSTTK